MKLRVAGVVVGLLSLIVSLGAQTSSSRSAVTQVPPLIQFSNVAVVPQFELSSKSESSLNPSHFNADLRSRKT